MNAPVRAQPLPRFASALKAIESLKPAEPLYLIHPEKFASAAKQFLDGFPGDTLYAVKANPHPVAMTIQPPPWPLAVSAPGRKPPFPPW